MTVILAVSLAAVCVLLIAAVIALYLDGRRIDRLTADNRNLRRNWRLLGADLDATRRDNERLRDERDRAQQSLREVLAAREAGYRWPRPQPMSVPPQLDEPPADTGKHHVDNSLTAEFTRIVERNTWPEASS